LWSFRFSDGVCTDVPTLKAELFPVRIVDGAVQVAVPEDSS